MINKTGINPKGDIVEGKSTEPAPAEDYSNLTSPQLLERMEKAMRAKDMKLVGALSRLYAKAEETREAAERDAKLKALVEIEGKVKDAIANALKPFIANKTLEAADGVWFAWDFQEKLTSLRLMKGKGVSKGVKGEGNGGGSYKPLSSFNTNSKDLLAKVGSHVMFKESTNVTIDKKEQVIKAGTTFQEAFDFSPNGGWRNRVTQALLKEAGLI